MRAGIAFGSNLGDRQAHLRMARERIERLPDVGGPLRSSALYETDPIDCEPGAQKFLNAVIEVEFAGQVDELLSGLRKIEDSLGRERREDRTHSRTIDLDLLYFGPLVLESAALQLPHPRVHERRFVLAPLADIRPALVLPRQSQSVAVLLRSLSDNSALVRVADEW
jgi:2-amino-4-hydroxy-6-hydroxymethyldihydropteridine diphosphokinase